MEIIKWLLNSPTLPHWFEAVAIIFASCLALFFGVYGNRRIWLLTSEKENQLDRESFLFLTKLPSVITGPCGDSKTTNGNNEQTSREFISEFETLILKENIYLSDKKLKEYNYIIKLANDLTQYPAITSSQALKKNREKLFYKIKKEAERKSGKVISMVMLRNMQNLLEYESQNYWQKNIYLISNDTQGEENPVSFFIYTEAEKKVRELYSQRFKNNNIEKFTCDRFSPKEYDLIKMKKTLFSDYILINYRGKRIKLKNNQPKNFYELGL